MTMFTALFARLAIGCLAVLPMAAHAQEIMFHHAQGETRVPLHPKVVATLDFALLDTLSALGVEVAGVPNSTLPPYLANFASDRYRKVGSLFEPDYEALNALAPDLILVGGRSAPKYAQVAKIAPTIDLSPDKKRTVDSTIEYVQQLGRVFGKEAQATARVDSLRQSIAALRLKTAKAGTGLLIMTSGGRMTALGPGSWFGMLYRDFGVKPIARQIDDSGPHGQLISSEFILDTQPDWIYVIDRDAAIGEIGASAKQLLDNEVVRQSKAWKAGHVVYLDPVNWYIVLSGLTSLQTMVDELDHALPSAQ